MRSEIFAVLSLFGLATGIACSGIQVSSDWDAEVDFSKIQTYAWIGLESGVEGIEGTDETIRRAGSLASGEIVVVKVCKPTQDLRFDLPAVGPETVRSLVQAHGCVLAVEAGRTVTLEREEMLAAANAAGVVVVGVAEGPGGGLEPEVHG